MSSLTEKKKREIENLYLKMKQQAYKKVMLYVICKIPTLHDEAVIADRVLKFIYKMKDIEFASYAQGTNTITVTANWKDYEVPQKIKSIMELPDVLDIKAYILNPLF